VPDQRHWDAVVGTPTIDTAIKRSGAASLRLNPAGASQNAQKILAQNVVPGRIYVYFASLPTGQSSLFRHVNANGNLNIDCDETGALTAIVGAGTRSATIATLTTGVQYRIDWLADSSANPATLKVMVDGGSEVEATNAQASVNITQFRPGTASADTYDARVDDLILGDSAGDYPFGEGSVQPLSPNVDGTHSFIAGDFGFDAAGGDVDIGATDVWGYVIPPLDDIVDFIRQKAINANGYVEVGFGAAPFGWDAQAVAVVAAFHAAGTAADTCGLVLNDGGSLRQCLDDAGDNLMDVSQTTVVFAEDVVAVPPSGGTWTEAKLNALKVRWGYSTDVTDAPYWDGVVLEVAYGAAPPSTYSPKLLHQSFTSISRAAGW